MNTDELILELEKNEYILPKDILRKISEEELAREVEEIFKKHFEKIEKEQSFRRKYIDLVNYLLVSNLHRTDKKQQKYEIDKDLIKYLLSTPEMA